MPEKMRAIFTEILEKDEPLQRLRLNKSNLPNDLS